MYSLICIDSELGKEYLIAEYANKKEAEIEEATCKLIDLEMDTTYLKYEIRN